MLRLPGGELRQRKPLVYQVINGRQRLIAGRYTLLPAHQVGFAIGRYDRTRPLIIDPVLSYSTFLGGSGDDSIADIAVDGGGNAYVTGDTTSPNFPITANAFQTRIVVPPPPAIETVFKTGNGAANWGNSSNGMPRRNVQAVAVNPQTTATLYTGTNGAGVFKSTNGGAAWNPVNNGLTNFDVKALASDPFSTNTLYAGTLGGGIFKSTNGGASWTAINSGLTDPDVQALAIHPSTTNTIYAGTANSGVFKSTNGGATWTEVSAGMTSLDVRALAIDPRAPATLYAGTNGSGVLKSTNGGGIWSPTGRNSGAIFSLAIDPGNASIVYAGAAANIIYKTTNAGVDWNPLQLSGAALQSGNVNAIVIDPVTPATLYAGVGPDPNGAFFVTTGVFKSTNGGTDWAPAKTGLTNDEVLALAIDPKNPATLYAGTTFVADTSSGVQPDMFVAKLTPDGSGLVYATYLGGGSRDSARGIAIDSSGNAYVTGSTASNDFPTTVNAFDRTLSPAPQNSIAQDAFVSKLNATGAQLLYSTFLGGSEREEGLGIAVNSGNAYVTGIAGSDFPTTTGAFDTSFNGTSDAFVAKLNTAASGAASLVYSTFLGGAGIENSFVITDGTFFRIETTG
ncbi:MAG: SBBP repeat-containing protein, partial [Armatimonadota bacterium]|nr:SBBP repeat-containing protein [Armatimonadota bacterium]